MKKIMITTLVLTLAGLGMTSWAEPGPDREDGPGAKRLMAGGPGGPEAMGAQMLQRLLDNPEKMKEFGITDEQAAKLKASFYELEKKLVTLQGEAEMAQIEVRRLMDDDGADEAALMAAVDKAGQARTAIQKAMIQQRLMVRKTVGDDTLKKIKAQMNERMRQSKGAGEGPRGPEGKMRPEGKNAPWQQDKMEPPPED